MNRRMLLETVFLMIIFVTTVTSVSIVQKENGRIYMCQELGLYYTSDGQCLTCEETGRVMKDGNCIIAQPEIKIKGLFNDATIP